MGQEAIIQAKPVLVLTDFVGEGISSGDGGKLTDSSFFALCRQALGC